MWLCGGGPWGQVRWWGSVGWLGHARGRTRGKAALAMPARSLGVGQGGTVGKQKIHGALQPVHAQKAVVYAAAHMVAIRRHRNVGTQNTM